MKKYTDVDIVAELQKLVDSHVDSYKEDFDIDKRIIRRAAESQNPEDKTLMWFCRPHGTHCLNENQVFIQGTRDHNTFRFYAEQTYDECVARVIVPKAVKRGKVFGDVFEINYREQAANVAQNSVAPDHDRLTFADGFVLDAPCRSSFDAAMALVGEHGGVKTHQTLPKDAEALAEVLSKQKSRRDRLPEAERTEVLSPLPVAELRKYEAVKKAHPDALVCFAQNGYFDVLQLVESGVHLCRKAGHRGADKPLVAALAGELQSDFIFRLYFHYVNLPLLNGNQPPDAGSVQNTAGLLRHVPEHNAALHQLHPLLRPKDQGDPGAVHKGHARKV